MTLNIPNVPRLKLVCFDTTYSLILHEKTRRSVTSDMRRLRKALTYLDLLTSTDDNNDASTPFNET